MLYNTTPIHCTPLQMHPPLMNTHLRWHAGMLYMFTVGLELGKPFKLRYSYPCPYPSRNKRLPQPACKINTRSCQLLWGILASTLTIRGAGSGHGNHRRHRDECHLTDTGTSVKKTAPERNAHGNSSFQSTKSGAGLQFLLPGGMAKAQVKGVFSQTPASPLFIGIFRGPLFRGPLIISLYVLIQPYSPKC